MKVYKSKYLQLCFFAKEELIEMTWFPYTENMSDQQYKKEFLNYLEIILKFKPKRIIPDNRHMLFLIIPELQEWISQTIFIPSLKIGLNKVAFVVSNDFFSQLSIEQTMAEPEGLKFITKYFSSKEDARKWILSF